MKLRVKFSKYGAVKFIGHLDVMRYFQKAIRRAKIDIVYSKGFNPHQEMSFASPLGVGLTSDGEYFDIELNTSMDTEEFIASMNQAMSEGFYVSDALILPEPLLNQRKETAMSLVAGADYLISLKDGYELLYLDQPMKKEMFFEKWNSLLNQESLIVMKKTKKSEQELNLKEYIYEFGFTKENFYEKLQMPVNVLGDSHAQLYHNGYQIYLQLSAGSVVNIKPELLLQAFFERYQISSNPYAFQIHRMELYADKSRRGMTQAALEEASINQSLPKREFVSLVDSCFTVRRNEENDGK